MQLDHRTALAKIDKDPERMLMLGAMCQCWKETFRFASSIGLQILLTVPSENSGRKALIAFVSFIKSGRWIHALFLETIISCPACNHVQYGVSIFWTKLGPLNKEAYYGDSSPWGISFPRSLPLLSFFWPFWLPLPHFPSSATQWLIFLFQNHCMNSEWERKEQNNASSIFNVEGHVHSQEWSGMGIVTELFQVESYRIFWWDSKSSVEITESEICWSSVSARRKREHVVLWLLERRERSSLDLSKSESHSSPWLTVHGWREPGERFG